MYKGFYLFLLVVVFSQYCTVIVGIAIVVAEYHEILVLFDLQGYVASCSHRFSFTLIVPGPG